MEVMVNSELIKSLRQNKSWSQEKLAAATGLSLRTVQRVENSGTASLETRLALCAAFNIQPNQLSNTATHSKSNPQTAHYGYIGAGVGLICSYTGVTYSVYQGSISFGQAGIWYGIIGALVGVTCGIIGILQQRSYAAIQGA
jgi:transcriptional regulator with XRE-family HTH domain